LETDAKYTLVGSIVIILAIAITAGALWLGGLADRRANFFAIYFKDHSLAGLQVDSDITMRGIRVGVVSEIAIVPENPQVVRVVVRIAETIPVHVDSRAVLERNMLTGLSNIEIQPGKEDSPLLKIVPPGEDLPVIQEGRVRGMDMLLDSVSAAVERTDTMIARVNQFLSDENIETASGILENVESLTKELQQSQARVDELLGTANQLAADLREMASGLDQRGEEVSEAFMSSLSAITLEASNISQAMSQAAQSFSQTLEMFDDPAALLSRPAETEFGPGER